MNKKFTTLFLIVFSFILFSCTNFFMDNNEYGTLTLTMPDNFASDYSRQARAAENIDSLQFKIVLLNTDDKTQQTKTASIQENISFEVIPGLYNIKISAYNSAAPKISLYEGETTNIKVVAGETTKATVSLKRTSNLQEDDDTTQDDTVDDVIDEDITILVSEISNKIVLYQNILNEKDISDFQSDTIDLTKYFKGKLPSAGQTIKISYKGTINIDANKLYMNLADVETLEDGNIKWTPLLSDEQVHTPVATNIKANQEFEITESFTLKTDSKHSLRLIFCCGAEGRLGNPPEVKMVGDVIKVTPPSESYMSALLEKECDGYYISIASTNTPDGLEKWLCSNRIHLTDSYAFSDVDFGMELYNAFMDGTHKNEKIYPVINFYKNIDSEDGNRKWLAKVTGDEITYELNPEYAPAALTMDNKVIKITPPGSKFLASLIERGCDGFMLGILSGKTEYGSDNWIYGTTIHLNTLDAFGDVDFTEIIDNRIDSIAKANGEYAAVIAFFRSIDSIDKRELLERQYKSETYHLQDICIISFDTNGGSSVGSIGIPKDRKIYYYWYLSGTENYGRTTQFVDYTVENYYSMVPVPTKEGKVFDGWYFDEACTQEASPMENAFIISDDITLYAKWVDPCTINFVTNCDTKIPSITVPSGRDYYFHVNGSFAHEMRIDGNNCLYRLYNNEPNYPKKEGATITGWYKDSGFETPAFDQSSKFNAPANGNITLYAKWDN